METRVPAAGRDPNAVAGLVTVVVAAAGALDPFAQSWRGRPEETADSRSLGFTPPAYSRRCADSSARHASRSPRRAIAEELGLQMVLAAAVMRSAAEIELLAGDLEAAERALRPACEILEEMRDFGHLASLAPELADVLFLQGQNEEAMAWIDALDGRIVADDVDGQVLWRRVRAKLLAGKGQAGEAERVGREAVELAARTDYLTLHADARADLAAVLELASRPAEAREQFQQALALYEQKGNVVMVERMQTRIARGIAEQG